MAEIAPFRGIVYTARAGDPDTLLAPPYDAIDEPERTRLEAASPHNCVRLILPRRRPGAAEETKYAQAASLARAWLEGGVLARDEQPAIYRCHQVFRAAGREVVRKGFIARMRLRGADDGTVLLHQRTLAAPALDRLKLMRALRAHEFSQAFGLCPGVARASDALFERVETEGPFFEARTADGVLHRLFRLTDRESIRALVAVMAARRVYLADWHHRYQAMIALRDELRPAAGAAGAGPRSAVEYGVMCFFDTAAPGLSACATHRVLHGLPDFDRARLLERARAFFAIEEVPLGPASELRRALAERSKLGVTFALATPRSPRLAFLRFRDELDPAATPPLPSHPALREFDVTLLHALVLETLLGIDRAAQAAQSNLRYVTTWDGALEELRAPGVQAVFLMNPTKLSTVKAVADAGQRMPERSSCFCPKPASGLVMNPLDPAEVVA